MKSIIVGSNFNIGNLKKKTKKNKLYHIKIENSYDIFEILRLNKKNKFDIVILLIFFSDNALPLKHLLTEINKQSSYSKFVIIPIFKRKNDSFIISNDNNEKIDLIKISNYFTKFKNNIHLVDFYEFCKKFNNEKIFSNIYYYNIFDIFDPKFVNFLFSQIHLLILKLITKPKKLLIFDLDNTIWGGEVGDLSFNNIKIGNNTSEEKIFSDVQKNILKLTKKGIVLAVVSKNDEKNALSAFKKNKKMILKTNDLATWKINWDLKSNNIKKILNELNLTADSAVFLDDSLYEREEVKRKIKNIYVPDFPNNVYDLPDFVSNLDCFNNYYNFKSNEKRNKLYVQDRKRRETKENFSNENLWLKSLKIKIRKFDINQDNIERAIEMFHRINQFNLKTRRLNKNEILKEVNTKNTYFKIFSLKDKFGDLGFVGLINIKIKSKEAEIVDFLLSCRAFGRQLEQKMIYFFLKDNKYIKKLTAKLKKTKKNKPMEDLLKKYFIEKSKNKFELKRENYKLKAT